MLGLVRNNTQEEQRLQIRKDAAEYLYEQFTTDNGALSRLDKWTQRRVCEENLAKISLVLESDDPAEHCYQNLIRELDTEAQFGVYLARPGSKTKELRALVGDYGISGTLYQQLPNIAPQRFPDELAHSSENLDIVWVTIEARYDRAYLDAKVSELVMAHLVDDEDSASDMVTALRSLLYPFQEDAIRRECELPRMLDDRATQDLVMMIAELSERSGDYDERVADICTRAGTQ